MNRKAAASRIAALCAALLLMLQSVAGLAAAPAQVDAFGNPLCIGGSVHGQPAGSTGGILPDCCLLGCNVSAAPAALPPQAVAAAPSVVIDAEAQPGRDFVRPPDAHDPKSPRAPPPMS